MGRKCTKQVSTAIVCFPKYVGKQLEIVGDSFLVSAHYTLGWHYFTRDGAVMPHIYWSEAEREVSNQPTGTILVTQVLTKEL